METQNTISLDYHDPAGKPGSEPVVLTRGLNNEQFEAVTTTFPGHILVLAGAGSGKTSVLTRRIAFLIYNGTDQERIVALTFSRKAADEMAERAGTFGMIDRNRGKPVITTFHGFCMKVLNETVGGECNFSRLGYERKPELLEEHGRLELIASVTSSRDRDFFETDLFGLDSLLSTRAVFTEKNNRLGTEKNALLEFIENRFQVEKRKRNLWDFNDLINGTVALFSKNPPVAAHYASYFKAVLVDEFQDTNPRQIELLRFLAADGKSVFAVGDDDQAIYGFRGADIRPILHFSEHFTNAKIIKLQTNYRSVPPILNAANRIFVNKELTYRKILRSGNPDLMYVKQRAVFQNHFNDQESMIEWIRAKSVELTKKYGIPVPEMVLLFRLNQTLDWCRNYLEKTFRDSEKPQLMTVHGSKGLEFPVVFLCDLEEGTFPHYKIQRKKKIQTWSAFFKTVRKPRKTIAPADCDLDEERRLFYVGVTRAQRFLYLISVKNKEFFGRKQPFEKSRFLKVVF